MVLDGALSASCIIMKYLGYSVERSEEQALDFVSTVDYAISVGCGREVLLEIKTPKNFDEFVSNLPRDTFRLNLVPKRPFWERVINKVSSLPFLMRTSIVVSKNRLAAVPVLRITGSHWHRTTSGCSFDFTTTLRSHTSPIQALSVNPTTQDLAALSSLLCWLSNLISTSDPQLIFPHLFVG